MTRCLTATMCMALAFGSSIAFADAKEKAADMMPPKDSNEFAMKAAKGNLLEIRLAELAQQKAQTPEVKQLAREILQDHTQAGDQLKQIAQQKNVQVPSELMGEKQETFQAFQQLEGKVFEKNYVMHMIKAHLHDVSMYKNESQNGTDPQIKQFATQTLPKLQKHTAHVAQVAQSMDIPVAALAGGGANMGDTARPAGSRIEGTQGGSTGTSPRSTGSGSGTSGGTTSGTGAGPEARDGTVGSGGAGGSGTSNDRK